MPNPETPFIAILADMHLAPQEAGGERQQSLADLPERRSRHLEEALSQLAAGPAPAATLFGGDNANQPVSDPRYRHVAHDFMRRFPRPLRAIPGNHDVGSTVGWHHHDPDQLSAACAAFRKDWEDWWVLEAAGFRILGINSQIFGSSLPEAAEQGAWLRAQLARPRTQDCPSLRVVFAHTPPYLKSPDDDFSDGSEQMCLRPQARRHLLEILNASPPDLLITAHAHRFWRRPEPRWEWLGVPATALGIEEMAAVPSHNLPPGDSRVGWVALRREGAGWRAEMHPCS